MEWYEYLLIASLLFFVLKTIMSWVAGDTDIDVDFDGDSDFDVSGAFSFKGFVHFCLGFSSYLSAMNRFSTVTTWTYVYAFLTGCAFMLGLYWLYKFVTKADHVPTEINLNGMTGTIYNKINDDSYEVIVKAPDGTHKVNAYVDGLNEYNAGDTVKVNKDSNNNFYIQTI